MTSWLLTQGLAIASEGHGDAHGAADMAHGGGGSLVTVLFLLVVVALAYILTHFVVERLQKRYLLLTGIEYVLLGVVLGPNVVEQVRPFTDLRALGPIFAFAAGWVGLLYGMEFQLTRLLATADRSIRLALADALVTGAGITVASLAFFRSGLLMDVIPDAEAWPAAMLLGCAAGASSSSAVDLVQRRYARLETQLLPLLRRTARLGDMFALVAFGLIFCLFHPGGTLLPRDPVWAEWLVISIGLGVVLGMVFMAFLSDDAGDNDAFLAMIGILLFASGAAFFLELSALLVNVILGAVIVQTAKGKQVSVQLERTAQPVRLVLLLFAGALWTPVDPTTAAFVTACYILFRLLGKTVGGWLATLGTPLRSDVFRGLLAQGDVAVAMAISAKLVYGGGAAIDVAYTAILVSVAFHELVAPRSLRGLLVDAGELREDMPAELDPPAANASEGAH